MSEPEYRGEIGWSFSCQHTHHARCQGNYFEPIVGESVPCCCPCHYPAAEPGG
jgi:hypothetical protein